MPIFITYTFFFKCRELVVLKRTCVNKSAVCKLTDESSQMKSVSMKDDTQKKMAKYIYVNVERKRNEKEKYVCSKREKKRSKNPQQQITMSFIALWKFTENTKTLCFSQEKASERDAKQLHIVDDNRYFYDTCLMCTNHHPLRYARAFTH